MAKGGYKCFFHKGQTFETNYYHFRATGTGCAVHGICAECVEVYGSYSNNYDLKPEQMYSFTDEYLARHPRLKEVSALREKRGV